MDNGSDPFRFGKTFLIRVIEKQQSELLLNLRIFYLSHAVCKILQFLMMKRDVKSDLTVIAKECLLKVYTLNFKSKSEHMLVDPQHLRLKLGSISTLYVISN